MYSIKLLIFPLLESIRPIPGPQNCQHPPLSDPLPRFVQMLATAEPGIQHHKHLDNSTLYSVAATNWLLFSTINPICDRFRKSGLLVWGCRRHRSYDRRFFDALLFCISLRSIGFRGDYDFLAVSISASNVKWCYIL